MLAEKAVFVGLSPRGRRSSPTSSFSILKVGLSPRGRRSHRLPHFANFRAGSISAWAEEPELATSLITEMRVYLRVGGGARLIRDAIIWTKGLSPRGRRSRGPT